MENNDISRTDNICHIETRTEGGLEVINIPLIDGANSISLTRLLAQHGITVQTSTDISDLQNGQLITVEAVQQDITQPALEDGASQVVMETHDKGDNQITSADGLPIVGNQMLYVPISNISQPLTLVTDYEVVNSNSQKDYHSNIDVPSRADSFSSNEKKIFSHVVAFLSEEVANEMFSNHTGYMDYIDKNEVFQMNKQEGVCTIAAELWALVLLQTRLQSLIETGKPQPKEFFKPSTCDKSVQTDNPKTTDSTVQTNYPIRKEGSVNCGTMCEILLPSVTAFGREIKQSGRYNTNAATFLSHSVDEDLDEEYTPRPGRRKKKPNRKYKSSSKDKFKQSQSINNDIVTVKTVDEGTNRLDAGDNVTGQGQGQQKVVTLTTDANRIKTGAATKSSSEFHIFSNPGNFQEEIHSDNATHTTNLSFNSHGNQNHVTTTSDYIDSCYNQSDNRKTSAEDGVGKTSASDFTPATSEDSMDMPNNQTYAYMDATKENVPNEFTDINTISPGNDHIQAALRASHINFEEIQPQYSPEPKMNGKKKSKKEYEDAYSFKFFCDKCSFKSKRQSHLLKHMKFHETVRKMFYCKQCNFKTIRNGALRRHEMTHSADLLHCNKCKYTTDDFVSLDRHKKLKHETPKRKERTIFKCPKCDYSTGILSKYAAHLRLHKDLSGAGGEEIMLALQNYKKEEEEETFQCSMCAYKTIRKEHLVRHINNVHTDIRPYLCDTCGQAFKRKDALSQHKITHVDKMNRNYSYHCSICQKSFRSKTHLNEHMSMHSTVRQYLCDKCGVSFKTKSCQQKHIKSIHQNPRSFECNSCFKRFNTKFALLRHLRTHLKQQTMVSQQAPPQAPPPDPPHGVIVTQLETMPSQIFTLDSQPGTLVQDIITTDGEVYETTDDNLQQVLLKTNDASESATAIMYLPSNLHFNV